MADETNRQMYLRPSGKGPFVAAVMSPYPALLPLTPLGRMSADAMALHIIDGWETDEAVREAFRREAGRL